MVGKGRPAKYEVTRTNAYDKWARQFKEVEVWTSKLKHKQEASWYLWFFCKWANKTPAELLALKEDPKSKQAELLLDAFVADEKVGPNSLKYNVAINVKSFFKHNYRSLERASGQITFEKKKPYRKHTKEELLKIYRVTQNPRDRALITFVWSTSIAKESLTKLQWSDIEEDWESIKIEFPHIGLSDVKIKGSGRGKYKGVEQHTFLTPEAKKDLIDYKAYIEQKLGRKLTPEDNVWLELDSPYKPLGYSGLTKMALVLGRRSGVPFGWHDARRYVETALEEVKMHPNWARKIRGRKVRGEENPYSRPAIEQLRNAYKEAVPLLQFTIETDLSYLKQKQEVSDRITSKILSGEPLTEEDRGDIKRFGLRVGLRREKIKPPREHNGGCAIAFEQIKESDLLRYLQAGYEIVHRLQSGDLIVKR